jgi:PAS domain S-box-containing protein
MEDIHPRTHAAETGSGTLPLSSVSHLLDGVSNVVYILDREWRFSYLNAPALRFFKKTPEEIIGRILWEVLPETLGSVFEREYQRAVRDRRSVEFSTISVIDPSRWLELRVYPFEEGLVVYSLDITERKLATAALKTNQARLKLVIDDAPALISYISSDFRYLLVNRAYEHWFGHPADEMIGKTLAEVLGEEAWRVVGPRIEGALAGERQVFEGPVSYRDGGQRWISATYTPDFDPAGNVQGVVTMVVDMTQQKIAETRLRESEIYHRSLFDASGVGNAEVDPHTGRFLRVNKKYCELVGYSEAELVQRKTYLEITHPDDRERNRKLVESFVRGESKALEIEKRYVRKDGSTVWVHVTTTLLVQMDGKSYRLLGVAKDITERRRAEEERQKFVSLAENSTEFIGFCDLQGRPLFVNDAGLRLVGLESVEEAKKLHVRDLFYPEDLRSVDLTLLPQALKGSRSEAEVRFRNFKTGQARWVICNVFPIQTSGGELVGFGTVSRDITDRRQTEEMLKESDKRKDEFIATLAHELRNPLAPISNALQIWSRVGSDPQQSTRLREIMERQVQQLKRLIDDLLDVSRISRGKIKLRREPLSIVSIIEGALESVRPMIDESGHTVQVELPNDLVLVEGDSGRLMQVFGNLLNNAAKYTPRKGQIGVRGGINGGFVEISVFDNGSGIPAEMLTSIFEAFTQVHHNLDRAQGGLGIGLTLVKSLVEMHGGTVEARSEGPGKGSEFLVRLPLLKGVVDHMIRVPWQGEQEMGSVGRHRVLVVDDLRASADTLVMMLDGLGQETRAVYDGSSALSIAEEFHPEVVISDIAMPNMDGYRLAGQLRLMGGRQPFLVALTGYGQKHDRKRAFDAGFDAHLVKPTSLQDLRVLLRHLESEGPPVLPAES